MGQRPRDFWLNGGHPLATGLVMAGLGRFPKSNKYPDSSLYGNAGTLTNMEPATDWVWSDYLQRWCLSLGGTDEYVLHGVPPLTAAPATLAAWIYATVDGASQDIISVNNNTTDDALRLNIGMATAGDPVRAVTTGLNSRIDEQGTVLLNTWMHAAATFSSATNRMAWLNGVPSDTAETTSETPSGINSMLIGATRNSSATLINFFTGYVTDVMIWNRALSPAEIAILANPSDTMLGGLILPPMRRLWAVSLGGVTPAYRNLILGGGVL
jgi:hypothetical protein